MTTDCASAEKLEQTLVAISINRFILGWPNGSLPYVESCSNVQPRNVLGTISKVTKRLSAVY